MTDTLIRAGMAASVIAALIMLHVAFHDSWDDPGDVDDSWDDPGDVDDLWDDPSDID